MEPVFIIALGILNIMAQRRNFDIDVEKYPHLKDIRVRRQADFQPYVFEDKHQNKKDAPDAIPEETFSIKSILKGERDTRVKRDANAYAGTINNGNNFYNPGQMYINQLTHPVSYYAPAPPTGEYAYVKRMKRSYSYDQTKTQKPYAYNQMNSIDNYYSTTNKPYRNYVAPLNGYNGYNPNKNVHNTNNNVYNPNNNVYNTNNNVYNPNNNVYNPNNNEHNPNNNVYNPNSNNEYNLNNNEYNPNKNGYNANNNGYSANNNGYRSNNNGYNFNVVEYNGYTQRYPPHDKNYINSNDVTKTNTDFNYNIPNNDYNGNNFSYNSYESLNNGTYISNGTVSMLNRTTSTAKPKINSAQFMVGFGCAGVLKYIKIGNTNLCVDNNNDGSDELFID